LQLLAAEAENGPAADRVVDRHADGNRGVDTSKLLDCEQVGFEVHSGAAVLLGYQHAEQPELSHLGEDLGGELAAAVPARRAGPDAVLGKSPDHVTNHALLLVEGVVHGDLQWGRRR